MCQNDNNPTIEQTTAQGHQCVFIVARSKAYLKTIIKNIGHRLVKEDISIDCKAEDMLENLLQDHEQVVRTAKEVLPLLEGANDEGTQSLLGARIEFHEKTAWMLKSILS